MFFARGKKSVEGEGVFAHVGVDQERYFGVEFAEHGKGRERNLDDVSNAADVHEDLVGSLVG